MAIDNPVNISNMSAVATYMNTATDSWFWTIILLSLVTVSLFIALNRGIPKEESFVLASFFGLIFSGLLTSIALVKSVWIFLFIMLLAVSGALLLYRSERSVI